MGGLSGQSGLSVLSGLSEWTKWTKCTKWTKLKRDSNIPRGRGSVGTMAAPDFDEDDFLSLGHEIRGNKNWQRRRWQAQIGEFRSIYGTHPRVLALIWGDLKTTPCRTEKSHSIREKRRGGSTQNFTKTIRASRTMAPSLPDSFY